MKTVVMQYVSALNDGGAETLVKDYSLLLNKEQFTVIVCVHHIDPQTANYQILASAGIKVIPVFKKKHNGYIFATFNKIFGKQYIAYSLMRIIKREHVNVIHIHFALLRYLQVISSKITNIRLFYTCHSLPERYFTGKYAEEKTAADYLIKNNKLQLIALHSEMKKELEEMFKVDNVVVVNNGPDFSKFEGSVDTVNLRNELDIPSDSFVLGHVGRFVPLKNHKFLIEIFMELLKIKPEAHLLLIGDGPEKETIVSLVKHLNIQNVVHILSHRGDVPNLLKTMNGFIMPSEFEGLSVALVEAQVAGLRCVISDTINKESILSKNTVAISLSNSAKTWCDVLLDDSMVSHQYGDISKYDLRTSVEILEKLYEPL